MVDPFGPAGVFLVSADGRFAFAEIVYGVTALEVGPDGLAAHVATDRPARGQRGPRIWTQQPTCSRHSV